MNLGELLLAQYGAMDTGTLLLVMGISFIIMWIIGSFFLYVGLGVAGVPDEKKEFMSVMITTLLVSLVQSFIPIIGCIIAWWIIKVRHTDSWGGAIVAWIIMIIIPVVIVIAILIFLGIGLPLFMGP